MRKYAVLLRSSVINNTSGFSLAGILAGVAVLSAVLVSSGYLLVQTKTAEVRFSLQGDLDRAHLIGMQKTRSVKFLKKQLGLDQAPADERGPGGPTQDGPTQPAHSEIYSNVALKNCLSRDGVNCNTSSLFPRSAFQEIASARSQEPCGKDCLVRSTTSYKVNCASAKTCESVDIEFTSTVAGREGQFKPRKTLVKLPAVLLADKAKINFACGQSKVIKAMDLKNLQAECPTENVSTICDNRAPLKNFSGSELAQSSSCSSVVTVDCTKGVNRVGMLSGQSGCNL